MPKILAFKVFTAFFGMHTWNKSILPDLKCVVWQGYGYNVPDFSNTLYEIYNNPLVFNEHESTNTG